MYLGSPNDGKMKQRSRFPSTLRELLSPVFPSVPIPKYIKYHAAECLTLLPSFLWETLNRKENGQITKTLVYFTPYENKGREEDLCSRDGLRKLDSIAGPRSNNSFSMAGSYVSLRDIPNEQTQ